MGMRISWRGGEGEAEEREGPKEGREGEGREERQGKGG